MTCQHQFFEVTKLVEPAKSDSSFHSHEVIIDSGVKVICALCVEVRQIWSDKGLIIGKKI